MTDDANGRFVKGDPADIDPDDDTVAGSEGLSDDIRDGDLAADEDPGTAALPNDDPDAPAEGEPFSGEVPL
jgi:hypothetical protein